MQTIRVLQRIEKITITHCVLRLSPQYIVGAVLTEFLMDVLETGTNLFNT